MKRRLLVVASLAMLSIAMCYAGGILISPLVSVDNPRPDLVPKGARVVRDFRLTGGFFQSDGVHTIVFRCDNNCISQWKKDVERYTGTQWTDCPVDDHLLKDYICLPSEMYKDNGEYNCSVLKDQGGNDFVESVFYHAANDDCWWVTEW